MNLRVIKPKTNKHEFPGSFKSTIFHKYVSKIDEPYKSIIHAYYYEMKSCAEIARKLGIPESEVRNLLKKAKLQFLLNLSSSSVENHIS